MLIDWFTVGAQFVNFLVLVVVMKRLLYRPILEAMAAREKHIATTLTEAEQKETEAAKALTLLHQREAELEGQRVVLLKKAAAEAEEKRKQLIAAARDEVSTLQTCWHQALAKERDSLRYQLMLRVQSEVLAIVRQVLRDLAGAQLEEAIARRFVRQLRTFPREEKERIAAFLRSSGEPVVIRSVFPMPKPIHSEIEIAVREELWSEAKVGFETVADLVGGVELVTAGHKISWNIEAYLFSLEKSLNELLEPASKTNASEQ